MKLFHNLLFTTLAAYTLSEAKAENNSNHSQASSAVTNLPIVDLGYALHQGSLLNGGYGYYNFSNIRYASSPVGDLRFNAPVAPLHNRSAGVQDGSYGSMCPQHYPDWLFEWAAKNDPGLLEGMPTTGGSEDCLFLDVVVPQRLFNKHARSLPGHKSLGAKVIVWIYGGGYIQGDKSTNSNPVGLLDQSDGDVIFVAFNYRLGAFGFLSGPTLQANGSSNAGLLDQRFALEWVQKYIYLFGGDPSRVTVMGESAGGGSIMHQITAYGGLSNKPTPFQHAVVQSPGFQPYPGHSEQEQNFRSFLQAANTTSLDELRRLPAEALIRASDDVISTAAYGTFAFGPVVDGNFVPDLPGKLLMQGNFDRSLKVMVGHNADEGQIFTDPTALNTSKYIDVIRSALPTISQSVLDYISNELYPEDYSGKESYTTPFDRLSLTISELFFTCNTNYLDKAFGNQSFSYLFSVPPALHGQDTPYVFFNGPNPAVKNITLAYTLQKYILQFVATGSPATPGLPKFPQYGPNGNALNLNLTEISVIKDPTANRRCDWWQKALYI